VHAFTEGGMGPSLLGFFGLIVLVSVGLIGWRGDRLRSPGSIDSPVSREGAFLANNVLFGAFAFVVLLGTVFPLLIEAWNDDRISVGEPYFDRMAVPIGLALLFMMAVAPVLPWRATNTEVLATRLQWPAWAGAGALVVAVALGETGLGTLLGYGLAGFAAGSAVRQIVLATRRQGWRGFIGRANGGMIVHLGVILIGVAIIASNANLTSREVTLAPGESAVVHGHTLTYEGIEIVDLGRKVQTRAAVRIDGGQVYEPAISDFVLTGQRIGTPSVRTTWRDDIALTLLDVPDDVDGPATIRAVVQPLIVWLWIGGGVIAAGTVLAAFPGGRRRPTDPVSAPVPTADDAPDRVDGPPAGAPPVGGAPTDERDPIAVPGGGGA